ELRRSSNRRIGKGCRPVLSLVRAIRIRPMGGLRWVGETTDASCSSHRRGSAGMSYEIEEIARADDAALARLARLIEPGSLLEATPECLVVAHADGRIVFANHHMEALT